MVDFIENYWLDITTTVLGLAYILLEYRASVWMWIVGFAMEALGIVLYYEKGLYADCAMEGYYMLMTVYGLWRWVRGPRKGGGEPKAAVISHFPRRLVTRWLAIMVGLWAAIWWLLVTFTNSNVPVADSFTTALSLVGVWALAHKYLEQWFIWIAVDAVSSVLYFSKDIPFKASLYALYVVIAIMGYFKWRRMMAAEKGAATAAASEVG